MRFHHLRYLFIIIAIVFAERINAQGITGVWEGKMGDEFLQINVEQKGNKLCGFTYDYQLANHQDHCRAEFGGNYYAADDYWQISGDHFIENSGNHIFMRIRLWRLGGDPETMLHASVGVKSFMGFFSNDEVIILKRVAKKPSLAKWMPPCFPVSTDVPVTAPKIKDNQPPVAVNPKKTDTIPSSPKIIAGVKNKDSIVTVQNMRERRQVEQSRLTVNVSHITLKLYDNGIVDNDTVSVFYNGKLLVSHRRLSEEAIELSIDLDKNVAHHVITLFAENLGGIPPNTALVVVTAGDKRYELHSKASLEENSVLVFDYEKPDSN